MSSNARFVLLLVNCGGEIGALVLDDGNVFCRDGAEDEEWVSRVVRRPGGAGAGAPGEDLLEAVLELIEVISED